jgi:hypothetical protein
MKPMPASSAGFLQSLGNADDGGEIVDLGGEVCVISQKAATPGGPDNGDRRLLAASPQPAPRRTAGLNLRQQHPGIRLPRVRISPAERKIPPRKTAAHELRNDLAADQTIPKQQNQQSMSGPATQAPSVQQNHSRRLEK